MKRFSFWLFVALGLLIGILIVRVLWAWWTPQCGEDCPRTVLGGIYLFFLVLPFMWAYAGSAVGRQVASRRRKAVSVVIVTVITVAIFLGLTVALHIMSPLHSISG